MLRVHHIDPGIKNYFSSSQPIFSSQHFVLKFFCLLFGFKQSIQNKFYFSYVAIFSKKKWFASFFFFLDAIQVKTNKHEYG